MILTSHGAAQGVTGSKHLLEINGRRLLLAMVPSLIAWPALLFDVVTGLWVLLAGFVLIGLYDVSRDGREGFPRWYTGLRCVLTGIVGAAHLVVLWRLMA